MNCVERLKDVLDEITKQIKEEHGFVHVEFIIFYILLSMDSAI